MIAFDTDVLTLILRGDPTSVDRLAKIPLHDQVVPIVVAEEMMRGRLDAIRKSQSDKTGNSLFTAFHWFQKSLRDLGQLSFLPFTSDAEAQVAEWKNQRIRVGVNDLRIAAICVAHGARLASRNRRDFQKIPKLDVEFWD